MKCPLLLSAYYIGYKTEPKTKGDCLKEECAAYDRIDKCCAGITLISKLSALVAILADIRDRIPTKEQFRK